MSEGSTTTRARWERKLDAALESPVAGLSPWILMAVIETPARFELAAAAALAVALLVVALSWVRGTSPKLLEFVDIAFFAGLTLLAAVAGDELRDVLEKWAGEISAGAVTLIVLGTIAARRPFTIQYARDRVAPELWDSGPFIHTNYVLSWVWCGAFALTAIGGAAGVLLLDQPNNFWTCWTIQAGAMILALRFVGWYPEVVRARARRAAGVPTDREPPLSALFLPLCPYTPPSASSRWCSSRRRRWLASSSSPPASSSPACWPAAAGGKPAPETDLPPCPAGFRRPTVEESAWLSFGRTSSPAAASVGVRWRWRCSAPA